MANLSITSECNQHCRYCFARETLRGIASDAACMTLATFRRALDFLERSGIDQVRLLGGEPTLHPDFPELVQNALARGFRVLVFSNGYMPEVALQCLEKTPAERTSVLINVSTSENALPQQQQLAALQRLGSRVLAGLNIDSPSVQFDFLLDLIERYQLAPEIRLGLAHPCVSAQNHFLHPRYYAAVGKRILDFAEKACSQGVTLEFDCGFTPCMFPPEAFEILGKSVAEIGQRCNPILDILSDGQVIACYPLASLHQEPLPDDQDASWLRTRFEERLKPYRTVGIFRECSECLLKKNGQCTGGCLAAAMQRWRHQAFKLCLPSRTVQIDASESSSSENKKWIIPYIEQPLTFWEQIAEHAGSKIQAVYFPLPGNILGSGRPSQAMEHLDQFLRRSPFPLSVLINPIILPRPVNELAPQIIEALKKLAGEFDVRSATVSDRLLAQHIRASLPRLSLTASVLMDIAQPNQVLMLQDVCDTLVPASRIMRDLPALKALRAAFSGKIRVIVNEACLPNCPFRVQHFYEMGSNIGHPHSLCNKLLQESPWLRLTGAWVLPQHLHLYDGVYDELKLAGRVTLRDPDKYLKVLEAYIHRTPLFPNEIGGGPASVLDPIEISEEFFAQTLHCGRQCHTCMLCQRYWRLMSGDFP